MEKITLGISSCLLGEKVRHDGTHRHDPYITETLGEYFEWVPVCPEVECGLGVPREAMRLVGDQEAPRLVTRNTGVDHTERMKRWAEKRLTELSGAGLSGFIFKKDSPSSGIYRVKVYGPSGVPARKGAGIFGGAFMRRFPLVPVEDDGRLHDPALRENFIERVFVYHRWQRLVSSGPRPAGLVEFHTRHKYLVLAHSPKHYQELGRIAARAGAADLDELAARYAEVLTEALKVLATARKNTNVLQHMAGYLKDRLDAGDRAELAEVIETYHRGLVPLVVPVTLIKHYVRKYGQTYLEGQYYLDPHPAELMLRNHV